MSDDNGDAFIMNTSSSPLCKQKKVTSEETRERKRRWEREKRIRDRIRIGREYSRWETLRKTLGTDKNETVAKVLLDAWFSRCSVFCSRCATTIHADDTTSELTLDNNGNRVPVFTVSQDGRYDNSVAVEDVSGSDGGLDDDDSDSCAEENTEMFLCEKPVLHVDSGSVEFKTVTVTCKENMGQEELQKSGNFIEKVTTKSVLGCEKSNPENSTSPIQPQAHTTCGSDTSLSQPENVHHTAPLEMESCLADDISMSQNFSVPAQKNNNVSAAVLTSQQAPAPAECDLQTSQIEQTTPVTSAEQHTDNCFQNTDKICTNQMTLTPEKILCIKKEPLDLGYEQTDSLINEYDQNEYHVQGSVDDRNTMTGKDGSIILPHAVYPVQLNCNTFQKSTCDVGVQWEECNDCGTQTEYDIVREDNKNGNVKRSRGRPRKSSLVTKVTRVVSEQKNYYQTCSPILTNQETIQAKSQTAKKRKKTPVKHPKCSVKPKIKSEPDWDWELEDSDDVEEEEQPAVGRKRKAKDEDPDFNPENDQDEDLMASDREEDFKCEVVVRKGFSNTIGRRKNGRFCKKKKKSKQLGSDIEGKVLPDQPVSIIKKFRERNTFNVVRKKYKKRNSQNVASKKKYEDIVVKLEEHEDKYEMTTYTSHAKSDRSLDMSLKSYSRFTCKLCNGMYNTRDKSYMEEHIKFHLQGRLTCKECGKTFSTIQNQRDHNAGIHKMKDYICEMCAHSFCSLKTLNHHLSSVHNEKPFKCLRCTERFPSNKAMRVHMYEVHPGSVTKCEVCGGIFSSQKTLGFHQASANCRNQANKVPEKVPCEQCGKLVIRMRMSTHIQRAHLKIHTFKCDKCPYTASTSCRIKFHMMTHTGEHPYRCELCTFSCIKPSQLKCHMRTHTGDKPYKCDQCSYASAWNVQLKGHKKAHDSPVKVDCKICNVTFKDDRGLSLHNKKEHSEESGMAHYRQVRQGVNNFYRRGKANAVGSNSEEQRNVGDLYCNEQEMMENDLSYRPRPAHYQKRDDMRHLDLSELEVPTGYLYRPFMNL